MSWIISIIVSILKDYRKIRYCRFSIHWKMKYDIDPFYGDGECLDCGYKKIIPIRPMPRKHLLRGYYG